MTNIEIHNKIEANNKKLQEALTPGSFILNKAIMDIFAENDKLQELCTHEFQNGSCIYCYKDEEVTE